MSNGRIDAGLYLLFPFFKHVVDCGEPWRWSSICSFGRIGNLLHARDVSDVEVGPPGETCLHSARWLICLPDYVVQLVLSDLDGRVVWHPCLIDFFFRCIDCLLDVIPRVISHEWKCLSRKNFLLVVHEDCLLRPMLLVHESLELVDLFLEPCVFFMYAVYFHLLVVGNLMLVE